MLAWPKRSPVAAATVVLVTHFMDEAEHLSDRVAIVDRGKLVALDTPQGLIGGLGLPAVVRFTTEHRTHVRT
jgi:ABC-2 type transport system ATP-binding protein